VVLLCDKGDQQSVPLKKSTAASRETFGIGWPVTPQDVWLRHFDVMYVNKWVCTVAAIFLQICGGLCYTFSLFSPSLKVTTHQP
jgi:hypothetical protein